MKSVNNKLLLEPYVSDGAIKTSVNKGFATVKQKSSLIPLKALAEGYIYHKNGDVLQEVKVGDLVYFKEEDLHTQSWAKTTFSTEGSSDKFIIADSSLVVMVKDGSQ
jgi:hypothetical protein